MMGVMRKPTFSICENKGADQLRGNHAADQRLCFCYIDCYCTGMRFFRFWQISEFFNPKFCFKSCWISSKSHKNSF